MKLFYIILLIILSNYSIFGQLGKVDNKIAKQILKSETIVILSESDTNYNNLLRKTVERYWKITNFTYSLESDLKNINGISNRFNDPNKTYLKLFQYERNPLYYMTLSLGVNGDYSSVNQNAIKQINDINTFLTDTTQIHLAIEVVQNHVYEGLKSSSNINKFDHYKTKVTKLSDGCILILDKELVENGYNQGETSEFEEELKEMSAYVNNISVHNLNIINTDDFNNEINNCEYFIEEQIYGTSGSLFVLYDTQKFKILNTYFTRNNRAPYYKMAWKKAIKYLINN